MNAVDADRPSKAAVRVGQAPACLPDGGATCSDGSIFGAPCLPLWASVRSSTSTPTAMSAGPGGAAHAASPYSVAKLDRQLGDKEVTVTFTASKLGGVAGINVEGKAPEFVIEAASEHERKDLRVWIEGELAEVLDRLQLSYYRSNPIKKGTRIVATGAHTFSAGAGKRVGHEWYTLHVDT